MNQVLLFLHLLGLMMGAAGGIGNLVIMRVAPGVPPAEAAGLRRLPPILAKVAAGGLALLWVTGVILVWSKYGGIGNLPGMFWVKFIFVLLLTAATAAIEMTMAQMKRTGNMALGARLAKIGPVSGLSSLLAVFFAVLAFG